MEADQKEKQGRAHVEPKGNEQHERQRHAGSRQLRRQMVCGTDSDHCSVSCSKANSSQI